MRWRTEGRPVPGQDTLDRIFADTMQRWSIRAATVAMAKSGIVYASRAYTWAEDEWPTTNVTTTFRIASVSKMFTCAAIEALAINLNQSVFAYLGLTSNVVHDPRADTITIGQCAVGQSGYKDFPAGASWRTIGRQLGHLASIQELAAYIYTVPLSFSPGMSPDPGGTYSNFAFHLLGAVIERASGRAYVDFVNQTLAEPMGIHDLRAGATGANLRLPGEVAGYDAEGVGESQLDLADGATAPMAYGGGLLLESAPGSGGLVTSATSIARFLGSHAAWNLGGRSVGTRYGTFAGTSAAAVSTEYWDFAFLMNREIPDGAKDTVKAQINIYLALHGNSLTPSDQYEDFPIRGVLLLGGFRTQHQLNSMSHEDMRNVLIVELTEHSSQTNYQAYDNATLAGMGAVMAFLLRTGIRDAAALKTMSADEQRNIVIVEIDTQTHVGRDLQGLTSLELVLVALGSDRARRGQAPGVVSSWIRGVLLVGGFRTQRDLNAMSQEDMRNVLIVELTAHSNQRDFQAYNNAKLEGAGAVMVAMRNLRIRDDATLRTMSIDDQRNVLIVELDAQTNLGASLQALDNLSLARVALGVRNVPR